MADGRRRTAAIEFYNGVEQLRTENSTIKDMVNIVKVPVGSQLTTSQTAISQGGEAQARDRDQTSVRRDLALMLYRQRHCRDGSFGDDHDVFGEPAWDMMLDLYVAACRHLAISVSSACIAASVPPSTALRWIAVLEGKGWVVLSTDPADRRRTFVSLTSAGHILMTDCLDRLTIQAAN